MSYGRSWTPSEVKNSSIGLSILSTEIADGESFGLFAFGQRQPEGCARCPQTEALVRQIPGLMMAGFSRLAPGAHIVPHCGYEGYAGYVLRFHLGLDIPENCALRVGKETRSWKEGGSRVFDDLTEHEAWNRSNRTRSILLCDFLNPLRRRPLILNPKFTPELIRYIERDYLPTRGLESACCGDSGSLPIPVSFAGRMRMLRPTGIPSIIREWTLIAPRSISTSTAWRCLPV